MFGKSQNVYYISSVRKHILTLLSKDTPPPTRTCVYKKKHPPFGRCFPVPIDGRYPTCPNPYLE